MSDWIALGLVAFALYLVECLVWVHAAAAACVRSPGSGRWRCTRGADLPGNDRGGLAFVDPLSVTGAVVVCHPWPFSVSTEGLTNIAAESGTVPDDVPRFIGFDEIRSIEARLNGIHVNGERFARVDSMTIASDLVDRVERVRRRNTRQRPSEIKAIIAETLDSDRVHAAWQGTRDRTRLLAVCCAATAAVTFVVAPGVLILIGPYPAWRYLLAAVLTFTIATAIAYFRAHRTLYPECRYERWVHVTSMVVLPVAAIRCIDKLTRDALAKYSAIVVAPLLCGADQARVLLRQYVIDLQAPLPIVGRRENESAARCAMWFREALAHEARAALDRERIAVFEPPLPDDEAMVCYCPRCHAQFGSLGDGYCSQCAGVHLAPFPSAGPAVVSPPV
jgi:hypothetical protein